MRKVDATNTVAHFSIEANDAIYRRFGVVADGGKLVVQYADGSGWRHPADLITNLQLNTWYVLRIVVDDVRGFYVEACQEGTSVCGSYNQAMPTGKAWLFHHWIYRGTAYLDDYREFSTSGLTWTPDERLNFSYDALDRLFDAWPEVGADQSYGQQNYRYHPNGNFYQKGNAVYSYNDTAHKHAVMRAAGTGGASKTIQIRASSSPCYDGVGATMELWVNGSKQQTWTNVSSTWTLYSQTVTLSGNDEIAIVFPNDCGGSGYDRNLFVDYVVVDGRTFQAEGSAMILDRGDPFDGQDILPGQEVVAWAGRAVTEKAVAINSARVSRSSNKRRDIRILSREGMGGLYNEVEARHSPSNRG